MALRLSGLKLLVATTVMSAATAALAGQPYYATDRFTGTIWRLEDVNSDGDALDAGERTLWADGFVTVSEMDADGPVVFAAGNDLPGNTSEIVRLEDLNGDGDALDVGERTVWGDGPDSAFGIAAGLNGNLYASEFMDHELWRLRDDNGDGDALDTGERQLFAAPIDEPTSVMTTLSEILVTSWDVGQVHRIVDTNGDGDALDAGENVPITPVNHQVRGIMADGSGGFFFSSTANDTVYRARDLNGDGDMLDVAETLSYADPVFGDLNAPWGMAPVPGGGFLLADHADNQVLLVRDVNGDGDALDLGEVTTWADGFIGGTASLVAVGPGPAGNMLTIQNGPGTLDDVTPNFIPVTNGSTVDHAAIDGALNGSDALVSTDNVHSLSVGRIVQNADAPITKTSGGAQTLTMQADENIVLGGGISSTSGALHVTLVANDVAQAAHDLDTGAGDVIVAAAVDTDGGDLNTSGVNFDNTGGAIAAAAIDMNHTGAVTIGAPVSATGPVTITAPGGINITATGQLTGTSTIDLVDHTTITGPGGLTANGTATVNGATLDGATIDGSGLLHLNDTIDISGNTAINTATLDWDGNGSTTVLAPGSSLSIGSTVIDDEADGFDGTVTLGENSTLTVNTTGDWNHEGVINLNDGSTIAGSKMIIGTDPGAINALAGTSTLSQDVQFGTGTIMVVSAGATLQLTGSNVLIEPGSYTGAGEISPLGAIVTFDNGLTVIGVETYNLDDAAHTIISHNSNMILSVGQIGDSSKIDGTITVERGGQLHVDQANVFSWEASALSTINFENTNPESSLNSLTGERAILQGTLNVNGGLVRMRATATLRSDPEFVPGQGVDRATVNMNPQGILRFDNDTDIIDAVISGGGTLRFLQELTGIADIESNVDIDVDAFETVQNGTVNVNGSNIRVDAVTLDSGSLTLDAAASFEVSDVGTAPGAGFFVGAPGGSGSVSIDSGATLATIDATVGDAGGGTGTVQILDAASQWTVGGTLSIQDGGTVEITDGTLSSGNAIEVAGGQLSGTGTVAADINNTGGTVSPGLSPGVLTMTGSYTQGAGGSLDIEIGGTTVGSEFDQVNVTGAATLDGNLDVALIDAFFPTPGETFEIMTFASRSGEFGSVTGDVGLLDPVTFLLPLYSSTNLLMFTAIAGDGNLSGSVEAADYTIWADGFGMGDEFTEGDYSGNGTVGAEDYTIWANNFGLMSSAPASPEEALAEPVAPGIAQELLDKPAVAPSNVPEPSSLVLALLGISVLGFACRRRGRSSPRLHLHSLHSLHSGSHDMRLTSIAKRALFGGAAATIALAVWGERAIAQIKLNGPLVAGGWVDPGSVQFSPDSSRVLYRADQEVDEVFELYTVSSVGGTPVKLNGPLPAGGDAFEAEFSADSARVLYRAVQDTSGVTEVYVVPSVGGTPLKLNGPFVPGGDAFGAQFTPDSTRVVYSADQETNGVVELYSVPSTGGTSVKLNDPLAGAFISAPLITSVSARVVYQLFDFVGPIEIYSAPTSGGTVVKLNGPLVTGGDAGPFVDSIHLSPAGDRVLYIADQDIDEVFEIYSVPPAGGTPIKLNGALAPGGDVEVDGLQFSPDSSRVLYVADQDTDEVREIYSVPSSGGAPVKLNGALAAGGDVLSFSSQFSPDSSRVLYRADQDVDNVFEVYSVPSAGGTPGKLNGPLASGGDVQTDGLQFSPDSSQVLYRADQVTDGVTELYTVPATGGTPVKLNAPLGAGGNVFIAEFSPDSSRVLYIADQEADQVHEIYLVPSDGGTPVKLNGPLVPGGLGISLSSLPQFSPDGSKVLYAADQDTFGVFEAYVRIVRERANISGGDWDTAATWDQGFTPDEVMQVVVDTSATVHAAGNAALRMVNDVVVGGGPGTSTLELASGASISTLNGLSIQPGGVLRGDGRIVGDVTNALGGEVRAQTGDTLTLSGTDAVNGGSIYLQGGTLEIDSPLTNETGGEILGRGTLFTGGLTNEGQMLLSAGVTDVFGAVDNAGGGEIIVSGLATATFFDDVDHNGDEIRTSTGSATVFFGDVTGTGPYTGSGTVFYEGTFSPGSSPAAVLIEGSAGFGSGSLLEIELGGPTPADDYDQLFIGGTATLDGNLDVALIDAFFPTPGETFEIMTFASRSGEFGSVTGDVGLLDPVTFLLPLYSSTNLLMFTAIAGDGNLSGSVEAADYTIWADGFGMGDEFTEGDYSGNGTVGAEDYTIWANNFGLSVSAPQGAPNVVPEPSALLMVGIGLTGIIATARRSRPRRR